MWSDAFERLKSLRELPEDWDSYGAGPPSKIVCDRVEEILRILQSIGWDPPSIVPCRDGDTIQLEWHRNGRDEEWAVSVDDGL